MRVLFANNYNMALARAGWRAGSYPAHHLYGTAGLGPRFPVVDLPLSDTGIWPKVNGRTRHRLGNLEQQLAAVGKSRPGAVIYGAQAQDLAALALLRRFHALPVPVVGVIHGKSAYGSLATTAIRGFDHIIALCEMTRQSLIDSGITTTRVSVLPWGPDLDFSGFRPSLTTDATAGVVATGKTGRDMPMLIRALAATGHPGRVYGDRGVLGSQTPVPANVDVVPAVAPGGVPGRPFTYDHTLTDLQRAALVAIPLSERYPLHGLTELADAIGCGKPVIVTRAPYFDIDIEAIGCGWWVDPGDESRWSELLAVAMSDPAHLAAMGRRGREWASDHWNARLFAEGLAGVLSRTAGRGQDQRRAST
ncbi:MAG: glycosyltransferase [Solirubrobacteraceae bacterium]